MFAPSIFMMSLSSITKSAYLPGSILPFSFSSKFALAAHMVIPFIACVTQAIKGMTIWAAKANFEEKEKGSIEPGKYADFVILDKDLMKANEADLPKVNVLKTYV